jgi:hypothetical protein
MNILEERAYIEARMTALQEEAARERRARQAAGAATRNSRPVRKERPPSRPRWPRLLARFIEAPQQ